MNKTTLALMALGLSACTSTAGPFVRTVTPLPGGGIRVERCFVKYTEDMFGREIKTGPCHEEIVPVAKGGD